VSRGQCGGAPTAVNLTFLERIRCSFIHTRVEWTPFQTDCYSENLAAPGIEPGTSGFAARKSSHQTTKVVILQMQYFVNERM
jgi:hypothetical protein